MSFYRRRFIPGGTYFFTVMLADPSATHLTDRIDLLRHAFRRTQAEHRFSLPAIVILPDHLHTVMTLRTGASDYPLIWNKVKGRFTRELGLSGKRSASKIRSREKGIWQRRFWEHTIRSEADYRRHVEYCWHDPIRHGLVRHTKDWQWSSFHHDVVRGMVHEDFTGQAVEGEFGERQG